MLNEERIKAATINIRELSAAIEELVLGSTGTVEDRYINRVVEAGVAIAEDVLALNDAMTNNGGDLTPPPYTGETVVVLLKKGEDVTVFPARADFSFKAESRVLSVKDLPGKIHNIDTKEYSASVYPEVGDLYNPSFSWQSDASKKREEEERAGMEAKLAKTDIADVLKDMRETKFDHLEQAIKTWLMHNGADGGDDWFTVETQSGYKNKRIRVTVNLDELDVSPKESNFAGKTYHEVLDEAISFYKGRCSV